MIGESQWRVINTGTGTASWNMSVDETLLNNHKEDDLPILRLYGWEPALSVGKFSTIQESVNLVKMKEKQISCVRRLSGGGILVHDNDLSYTIIISKTFLKAKSIKESYHYLCQFLICLYQKLGLHALFASESEVKIRESNICLAGCEPYDIVVDGQKMGGNAQRHTRYTLFQHGSIPMSFNESLFEPLFLEKSGLREATTLQKLGITMTYEMLSSMMIEAFYETFETEMLMDTLSTSEEQFARELQENKYTHEEWNINAKNIHL